VNERLPSVSRATLHGYVVGLVGLAFVTEHAPAALRGSVVGAAGVGLGLLALAAGALVGLQPERLARGSEAAPTALYLLAGAATAAAVATVVV
jgi:hypothetical protein